MENNEKHLCDYGCGQEAKYYFKSVKKWCCSKTPITCIAQIKKNRFTRSKKIKRENPGLCDYGCGRPAIFPLKNGKWCCSKRWNSCPELIRIKPKLIITNEEKQKMSRSRKGRKIKKAEKIKTSELCAFGCGKTAKYKLRSGKLCCSKSWNSCLILRLKNSRSLKGTIPWNLGLNKNNNEIMKKMSNDKINITFNQKFGKEKSLEISLNKRISMMRKPSPMKGRNHTDEVKKRIGLKSKEWWENHPEEKEKLKQKMLDGMSVYMQMFITNPSIPEIKLRNMVMLLIPDVLSSYPIYRGKGKRNYVVDMAILKYKLIIEYDGWYHFDSQESKDRDIIRQKNIEELGWRFLRYNMFSKLPTIENLKEDIEKIIGEKLANFKHVVG